MYKKTKNIEESFYEINNILISVIILKFNKNVLIAIFLLSVFAVGTLTFVDTVEAAKWKKYDSGSFNVKNPDPGYKKKISYVTYIKGSKDIKMNAYYHKSNNNKKVFFSTQYISKTGNNIKTYHVNLKGKKSKPEYITYKGTSKQFYKELIPLIKKYGLQ